MCKRVLSLILSAILILGCFGTSIYALTDFENADSLLLHAETEKTQTALNAAYTAIAALEDSVGKTELFDRADAVQKYISENVAGIYDFGCVSMPERTDTTNGSMLTSEVVDETATGGKKYLKIKYTGLNGEPDGIGQPRDFYRNVNWSNKIDGIARMTLTFNMKEATRSYYQLKLRYFSQMAQTELIGVSSSGIMAYDKNITAADKNRVIYSDSEGFSKDKWYTVTALINTTTRTEAGIPALAYMIYVMEEDGNVVKSYGPIDLYLASGMTDYTTPPANNARSRLLAQAYGSGATTNSGRCEILVSEARIEQMMPFGIIESTAEDSIEFGEKNVTENRQSVSLKFSERLDSESVANVKILDKNSNSVSVSPTANGDTLNIAINQSLAVNGRYTIVLSELKDIYGRSYGRYNIPFEATKSYTGIDVSNNKTMIKEGESVNMEVYGLLDTDREKIEAPDVTLGFEDIVGVVGNVISGVSRGSVPVTFRMENAAHEEFEKKLVVTSYYDSLVTNGFENDEEAVMDKAFDGNKSRKVEYAGDVVALPLSELPEGRTAEFWFLPSDDADLRLSVDGAEKPVTGAESGEWNQLVVVNNSVEGFKIYINGNVIYSGEYGDIDGMSASVHGGTVYIDSLTTVNCFEYLPRAVNLTISETIVAGCTAEGDYTYASDDEADEKAYSDRGSVFGWLIDGREAMLGSKTINIESNMAGKKIRFFVEPVNQYGIRGERRYSEERTIGEQSVDADDLRTAVENMDNAETTGSQADLNAALESIGLLAAGTEKNALYERAEAQQRKLLSENTSNRFDFGFEPVGQTSKDSCSTAMFTGRVVDETTNGGKKYLRVTYSGRDDDVDDSVDGFVNGALIPGVGRPTMYKQIAWDNAINGVAQARLSFNLVQSSANLYDMRFRYFAYEGTTELIKVNKTGVIDVTGAVVFGADDGFEENKWYTLNAFINTTKQPRQGLSPLTYIIVVSDEDGRVLKRSGEIALPVIADYGNYVFNDYTVPSVNATNTSSSSRLGFYTGSSAAETVEGFCEFRVSEMNLKQVMPFVLEDSDVEYGEKNVSIGRDKISLTFSEKPSEESISQIRIVDSCMNNLTIAYETEGNTVDLLLTEPLAHSENYIIDISDVCDIYGRPYERLNPIFETQKEYTAIDVSKSATMAAEGDKGAVLISGLFGDRYETMPNGAVSIEIADEGVAKETDGYIFGVSRGSTPVKYKFTSALENIYEKALMFTTYYAQKSFNGFESFLEEDAFEGNGSLKLEEGEYENISALPQGRYVEFWFKPLPGASVKLVADNRLIDVSGADVNEWNQLAVINNMIDGFSVYVNGERISDGDCKSYNSIGVKADSGRAYIDNVTVLNCFENLPNAKATISGSAVAGNTIYGGYTYSAADKAREGATRYGWLVGGVEKSIGSKSYVVASADAGKGIRFFAEPVNIYGIKGERALSAEISAGEISKVNSGGGGGGGGGFAPKIPPVDKSDDITDNSGAVKENIGTSDFDDVKGHWAEDTISFMADKGYIKGNGDGKFAPDNNVTRAEFAAIAVRILNLSEIKATNEFTDISAEDWFYEDVLKAHAAGLVNGFDGQMRPNAPISREEMAVVLANMLGEATDREGLFEDSGEISSWAKDAVEKCVAAGIIKGDGGKFYPMRHATRAEVAVVMKNMLTFTEVRK